jgi:uncharacterized membrane protein YjjP (DUF1212 family)
MSTPQLAVLPARQAQGSDGVGIRFVLSLGRALHRYGTPAHRLEDVMTVVSSQLGLKAGFVSTPTAIYASFGPPEEMRTTLIRVDPGEVNLERLASIDAITTDVISGRATAAEAAARLEEVLAGRPYYRPAVTVVSYALAAASAAQLFGGQLEEIGVSGILGFVLGLLTVVAERRQGLARAFEPIAAFVASALSMLGTWLFGGYATEVTTLAPLIYLLPGLTLMVAMTELATRHLVSGTTRLMSALLVFMQFGFGVALGQQLGRLLPAPVPIVSTPMPGWTDVPMALLTTLSLAVLFKARRRDLGQILVAGALAYGASRLGAQHFGSELGAFVGALVLGIGSNLFARWLDRPAMVTQVPGSMLLVPGSLGFRGVESFLGQDVLTGVGTAFNVFMVALALAAGTLLANSILPPRKIL